MLWISTSCLKDSPLDLALENLGSLTRGIEIVDGGLHRIMSASLLESYPYKYSIRIPQLDLNLASIIEPVRQSAVAVLTERFTFASEVGAEVVVNPGYVSSPADLPLAKRQLAKSCSDLIHAANEYGITFFFRNRGRWGNYLLRLPQDMNLIPQVPLALDIGHAHVNGVLPQFLSEATSRYVYLYDCHEVSEEHLEVRKGSIDFKIIAAAINTQSARGVIDAATYRSAYNDIKILRQFGIG